MITQEDRQLYKKLSILFGAFQELIQGAGGNISIKSDTQILLKASGTCLSEATDTEGFVLCNRSDLAIVEGTGKPSMESGFHLLPKRIIVHFHSLSCLSNWDLTTDSVLTLPYIQPGDTLSSVLQLQYTGQSIVNLENHGLILFADTEEEVYSLLTSIYPRSFVRIFQSLEELYDATRLTLLEIPNAIQYSMFKAFTPDLFLFLKQKPLSLSYTEDAEYQLAQYLAYDGTMPSIVYIEEKVFCLAASWKKCILVRDMYEAYMKLMRNPPVRQLSEKDCSALLACEKEAYRLRH
jgi:rhamnose utilization protein RhaD (predicted bifunctional aldolase and dehydrogenase)